MILVTIARHAKHEPVATKLQTAKIYIVLVCRIRPTVERLKTRIFQFIFAQDADHVTV